jgi:uroporphyrinogen-III synthase
MLDGMSSTSARAHPWRVAVTREAEGDDALRAALVAQGFEPIWCAVLEEGPPGEPRALERAALAIERHDWVVCASRRAVAALMRARGSRWPAGVRTAAVGPRTAAALLEAGAHPPPVVAAREGAEALWQVLESEDRWIGRRVLVPTVPGGLRILAVRLREAGARVHEVEAYTMRPRPPADIRADWDRAEPHAVLATSPSAVRSLARAVGVTALKGLRAVVAVGPTTAAALAELGVDHTTAPRATPDELARHLATVVT